MLQFFALSLRLALFFGLASPDCALLAGLRKNSGNRGEAARETLSSFVVAS
jgi:hypothetical protein